MYFEPGDSRFQLKKCHVLYACFFDFANKENEEKENTSTPYTLVSETLSQAGIFTYNFHVDGIRNNLIRPSLSIRRRY